MPQLRPTNDTPAPGLTLQQLAEAKGLPVEFLKEHGLRDDWYHGRPAVAMAYNDEHDVHALDRHRIALTGDRFRQPAGVALLPYGLGKAATEANQSHRVACEGETDALTCWLHGISAIGIPGAASWQDDWARYFDDVLVVYVIQEPDAGGEALVARLACSPLAHKVMVVRLPGAKDVNDFYLQDPSTFAARFAAALGDAEALPEPDIEPVGQEGASTEGWERPTPLELIAHPPAFPTAALPAWLRAYVEAEAMASQTPSDLAAMLGLGTLATVAGGTVDVAPTADWHEPVNLFVAAALAPGSRKSAVFRDMTRPIHDYERELAEQAAPEIARAAARRRLAEKRLARLEDQAAKATDDLDRLDLEHQVEEAAAELAGMAVPVEPRRFTSDVTSEALGSLLADHGGRFAVLSPEGGVFDTIAGLYSKGLPNPDVYLKGHAGDTLRVDRRGRPSEYVERPALTLCLAVQPASLVAVHANPGLRDRGLLERFLFSIPIDTVGHRAIDPPTVPAEIRGRYETTIRTIAASLEALAEPIVLSLSPGAREALLDFRRELEPRLASDGDLAFVRAWASKLPGATVRLAGLLHVASHVTDGIAQSIDAATMDAAITIARYLIPHALVAFERMGADPRRDDARAVLDWIAREHTREFSRREAQRAPALRSRFPKVSELTAALALLVEHGFIRGIEPQEARPKPPGRPSTRYAVNPYQLADSGTEGDRTGSEVGSVHSVRMSEDATVGLSSPSPAPADDGRQPTRGAP